MLEEKTETCDTWGSSFFGLLLQCEDWAPTKRKTAALPNGVVQENPLFTKDDLANARNADNVQKAVSSSNSMSSHGCQTLYLPTYQKYTGWKFKPKGKGWQPRNYTGYGRGGYKPSKGFSKERTTAQQPLQTPAPVPQCLEAREEATRESTVTQGVPPSTCLVLPLLPPAARLQLLIQQK